MSRLCILTDNTAQFTGPGFAGSNCVRVVPSQGQDRSKLIAYTPPSAQDFFQHFSLLDDGYEAILVLVSSAKLNRALDHVQEARSGFKRREQIQVIDTQNVGLGLGLVVQAAALAAEDGASLLEVQRRVHSAISRVYSLFCFRDPIAVVNSGSLAHSQALIAEMMGIAPMYTMEEGRLSPSGKVKTPRRILDFMVEFAQEFHNPCVVGFGKNCGPTGFKTGVLKQAVRDVFPRAAYFEQRMNSSLLTLFGQRSMCLTVMENVQ